MNWGIVGTGMIATQFAEAIPRVPGAQVTAVSSRDPAKAAGFAASHGAKLTAADAGSVAALPEVEVVYVATPHHRHEEDALAVIAAGKPVLCEKPLTTDAASARRVAEAARGQGVFAMEGMWSLCQPSYRNAFERIAAGAIGDIRALTGNISVPMPYDPLSRFWDPAQGGGALLDRGVYLVAIALALMDDPRPIEAASTFAPSGVDASTSFTLEDARGRRAVFSVGLDSYGSNELVIQGSDGRCVFLEPVTNPPAFVIKRRPAVATGTVADGLSARLKRIGVLRRLERGLMRGSVWSEGGLQHEIAEVERCLRANRVESPLVPLDRSIRTLEILGEVAWLARR